MTASDLYASRKKLLHDGGHPHMRWPMMVPMLRIPRRYSHFVFGVIQSGLTSFIAAGIASWSLLGGGRFLQNWMASWLISWIVMLPAVLFAAPAIRRLALALTRED
jgi:hypothetical protein